MPSFVGKRLVEAKVLAAEVGLTLEFDLIDALEARGEILDQIPAAGSEIVDDPRVWVEVSDGIVLPGTETMTVTDASEKLADLGLTPIVERRQHLGVMAGIVAVQRPSEGTRIDPTSQAVWLDVSNDPGVQVPSVGRNVQTASEAVAAVGLIPVKGDPGQTRDAGQGPTQSFFGVLNCDQIEPSGERSYTEMTGLDPPAGTWLPGGAEVILQWRTVTEWFLIDCYGPEGPDFLD